MRTRLLVPILLGAVIAVPATATAAPTQTFNAGAELINQPKGQPWNMKLFVETKFATDDGSPLSQVRRMQMKFPAGAKFNGSAFATCTLAKVEDQTCPARSKLGTGSAVALLGPNPATDSVDANVVVYNGPGTDSKRQIFMHSRALATVQFVLKGTMRKASGKYGYTLDIEVPQIVPELFPGGIPIVSFDTSIGGYATKKGKRVPLVSSPTVCKGGWNFSATFTYASGAVNTVNSAIPCRLAATPVS